jgi:hypothetical protein
LHIFLSKRSAPSRADSRNPPASLRINARKAFSYDEWHQVFENSQARDSVFADDGSKKRLWLYTRERWIWGCFIVGHAVRMASNAGNDEIILLLSARENKSGPP